MKKHGMIEAARGAGRVAALFGVFGLAAVGVSACSDTAVEPVETAEVAGETTDVVAGLTGEAGLSSGEIPGLREVIEAYEGRLNEPGTSWYLAADLQAILASEQIAAIAGLQEELGQRLRERAAGRFGSEGERGFAGERQRKGGGFGPDGPQLSDEQQAALEAIIEKHGPELDAIREAVEAGALDRESAREQMEALRDAIHGELKSILTEEQRTALDEKRAEREKRRAEFDEALGDRVASREAEMAAMQDALGLSPDQVAAIEALRETGRSDSEASREERRAAHQAAMNEILSDGQKEIVILHRAISSRMRIRRIGAAGAGSDGFSRERREFGRRGGAGPDGSGRGEG